MTKLLASALFLFPALALAQQAAAPAVAPIATQAPASSQPAVAPIPVSANQYTTVQSKIFTYNLKNTELYVYLNINVAIGETLVIEHPEGFSLDGDPIIGDKSLLRVEIMNNPLWIKVWGEIHKGKSEGEMYGLNSTIQYKSNAGINFILNCTITPPDVASNRIIFKYPEWDSSLKGNQRMIAEMKTKLMVEFEKKEKELGTSAEKIAFELMTRKYAEHFMCNIYTSRTEEKLVFLISDRICRIGDEWVFIDFKIKNRRKQYFFIDKVRAYVSGNGGLAEVDTAFVYLPKTEIQFDEVLNGAIGIKTKDFPKSYTIVVDEEGGQKRSLKMEVGF